MVDYNPFSYFADVEREFCKSAESTGLVEPVAAWAASVTKDEKRTIYTLEQLDPWDRSTPARIDREIITRLLRPGHKYLIFRKNAAPVSFQHGADALKEVGAFEIAKTHAEDFLDAFSRHADEFRPYFDKNARKENPYILRASREGRGYKAYRAMIGRLSSIESGLMHFIDTPFCALEKTKNEKAKAFANSSLVRVILNLLEHVNGYELLEDKRGRLFLITYGNDGRRTFQLKKLDDERDIPRFGCDAETDKYIFENKARETIKLSAKL